MKKSKWLDRSILTKKDRQWLRLMRQIDPTYSNLMGVYTANKDRIKTIRTVLRKVIIEQYKDIFRMHSDLFKLTEDNIKLMEENIVLKEIIKVTKKEVPTVDKSTPMDIKKEPKDWSYEGHELKQELKEEPKVDVVTGAPVEVVKDIKTEETKIEEPKKENIE